MSVQSWYNHLILDLTADTGIVATDLAKGYISATADQAFSQDLLNLGNAAINMISATTYPQVVATFAVVEGEVAQLASDEKTYLSHSLGVKVETVDLLFDYAHLATAEELLLLG